MVGGGKGKVFSPNTSTDDFFCGMDGGIGMAWSSQFHQLGIESYVFWMAY